jgi:RNA polymerase sigma-70 factor (ECF subfamily)
MTPRHDGFGPRAATGLRPRPSTPRRVPRTATTLRAAPAVASTGVDQATLEAFRERDPSAVRALYRAYGPMVYAVAHRVLGQHELAEEAAQQTFVRAWQNADQIDPGRSPASWLATVARNAAIDIYRRGARRPSRRLADVADDDPAVVSLPPDVDTLDAVWQVRAAIETLPSDEAVVVRLQHLDGMTHNEIAEKLDIAVGTVKSRSHRAHRKLASLLGHLREGVR